MNELTSELAFAVLTVVIFIGVFLGWREAVVVGLAVPICYGITLGIDFAFGYSINRVTLFALILSLGLLVDDPITGVDNIQRHLQQGGANTRARIVAAIAEIRGPLLMSTLTIVLAFVPLGFITGMMGPYMAPMAFNVPVSVIVSTVVAYVVTPWLAYRLLKPGPTEATTPIHTAPSFYERLLTPLLHGRRRAWWLLGIVLALLVITALLPLWRLVPLKLLPFDNKDEIQIVINLPEGSSLEQTAAIAQQVSVQVRRLPEVRAVAAYIGEPSPMDFNGLVRHYYQRQAPHLADLRVTLLPKAEREHQSHAIVLRLRESLAPLNRNGAAIHVVEVPPGPPVLNTLVAEIYGSPLTPYTTLQDGARAVMARLQREAHVVEIDSSIEAPQQRLRFIADQAKAALSGVAIADINQTIAAANTGLIATYLPFPREAQPLPVELRLPPSERAGPADLLRLQVKARPGIIQTGNAQGLDAAPQPLVAIGELGHVAIQSMEPTIYRKDLQPVVFVTADLSGRTPAEVIADLHADFAASDGEPRAWSERSFLQPGGGDSWSLPEGVRVTWSGEGEWFITVRVFRDLGLAFAFALAAIYLVLRAQSGSSSLALIMMLAIPLTVIGIMPGFWLLNQFGERVVAGAPDPVLFTATAMIGMIALAGIVVRNSLILVEFITQARTAGAPLREALLQAGRMRMRPVLLTAGTTLLGNLVITLDPVFSGLALAIIFGVIASTVLTLVVIPVVYYLVFSPTDAEAS